MCKRMLQEAKADLGATAAKGGFVPRNRQLDMGATVGLYNTCQALDFCDCIGLLRAQITRCCACANVGYCQFSLRLRGLVFNSAESIWIVYYHTSLIYL